ncbi:STAS domain-containing protein [Actinomadura parmotrematis]|uniref:Anti-sigma factor antagonist n=1 Tax=Actinomadura parmotrematis TaxID=2864039 RepID=A0ABS7FSA1_9ACTN|nr:STAS domain-containing protein [Actinomadura parmotrematis]MBW8482442.1 STAS domain-containing protein [Actinomadura parmotrematis]
MAEGDDRPAAPAAVPLDRLSVETGTRAGYAVARLAGSVELGNHEPLRERLVEALAGTRAALIVDMAQVTFCDSSGLGVFAHLARRCRSDGKTLVVAGLRDRVAQVFQITGMLAFLYAEPTVPDAVAWLDGDRRRSRPPLQAADRAPE